MNIKDIEKGSKRVLIIHGWMHSSNRYKRLANDLIEECCCTLLDLPGFGGNTGVLEKNMLDKYRDELIEIISNNKFDLIIGHSLGGNLILRVLEKIQDSFKGKIILINPSYYGINHLKIFSVLIPMNAFIFKLQSIIPKKIAQPFIKIVGLLSVNKWGLIDDILISDSRIANPWIAARVMYELCFDKWRIKKNTNIKNITILKSEKDRIIMNNKIEMLIKDIPNSNVIYISNVGHTLVLEDYDRLLKIIKEELRK